MFRCTYNAGLPKDNLLLSNNRAKAMMGYLLQKGFTIERVSGKGLAVPNPLLIIKQKLEKHKTEGQS
jgi:outer membrane protein OmpA-like peptidoglycan-associated protein